MKTPQLRINKSEGFVLGLAIDWNEIQIGLISWIISLKFRK